ncbi:MAG: hypothetical protein ABI412_01110 [Sphingomicrobium sp.]
MIFKRFAANLRAQNWLAIGIEVGIVVVGVFIGTWVANWNEERLQRAETVQMLQDLKPQLREINRTFDGFNTYFATTRSFGDTAFAGWRRDPKISDRDFVIAAYQASQLTSTGINNSSWAQIFGNDRLRDVDDKQLKSDLAQLMTWDYAAAELDIYTTYRTAVRKVIPEDIQDAIRNKCGDRRDPERGFYILPTTCNLNLPDARFAEAAKDLRNHPDLVGELRWHFAAIKSYVDDINFLKSVSARALKRIDEA